jgi:cytidylate kinase
MSSIIISTDFSYMGEPIAPKIADALGYEHLGPEFLARVAEEYQISPEILTKALDGETSLWNMSCRNRSLHLSFIQSAVWGRFLADNLVCEGLAAHLYIRDISHVLMVRILLDTKLLTNRIAVEKGVSLKNARKTLENLERRRRRWSTRNFGLDEFDPSIYDMVISLSQIEEDKIVEVIKDMALYRKFQPMTYSLKCVKDGALAARVKTRLLPDFPGIKVRARDGTVILEPRALGRGKGRQAETLKKMICKIPGVEYVEVHPGRNFVRKTGSSA